MVLYHGSHQTDFNGFHNDFTRRGGDKNSLMGVWLTTSWREACDYAHITEDPYDKHSPGCVLEVEASIDNYAVLEGVDQAYAHGVETAVVHDLRKRLMDEGVDALVVDSVPELGSSVAVLDADKLTVTDKHEPSDIDGDRIEQKNSDEPTIQEYLSSLEYQPTSVMSDWYRNQVKPPESSGLSR